MNTLVKTTATAMLALAPAAVLADDAQVTATTPATTEAGHDGAHAAATMRVIEDDELVLAERASNWMNTNVIDAEGETLGSVNDVILGADHSVQGVEVGVGGFLGIAETRVLIPLDRLSVTVDHDDDSLTITASITRDELEQLTDLDS